MDEDLQSSVQLYLLIFSIITLRIRIERGLPINKVRMYEIISNLFNLICFCVFFLLLFKFFS